jgi:hypothetical protein
MSHNMHNMSHNMHDYTKAIGYYEHAVKSGDVPSLREDLAALYIKLKQFDKAEKVRRVPSLLHIHIT